MQMHEIRFLGVSPKQCGKIAACVDRHFGAPGTPVELVFSAYQSDILILDLEAQLADGLHHFHVCVANNSAQPTVSDGFLAKKIHGHKCHREAAAVRSLPMAA